MKSTERTSLREIIRLLFLWIENRRPGPASVYWLPGSPAFPILLQLAFPAIHLTEEELSFFPDEERIFYLNGGTPQTLWDLNKVQHRLADLGGRFDIGKGSDHSLVMQLAIPGDAEKPEDASEKLQLIHDEIRTQIAHRTRGQN